MASRLASGAKATAVDKVHGSLEDAPALPGGHVPDPRRVVSGSRGQDKTTSRRNTECESINGARVPLEHLLDPPRVRRDEVDRSVRILQQSPSTDGKCPTVRGECRGVEHALATWSDRGSKHADRLAAGHVPEPDRLITGDGDQLLSIRREEDLPDVRGVPAGVEHQDGRRRRRFLGPDMLTAQQDQQGDASTHVQELPADDSCWADTLRHDQQQFSDRNPAVDHTI